MNWLIAAVISGVTCVLALSAADQLLRLLNFPAEQPLQIAYPSHFAEIRRNIEFTYKFRTNGQGIRYRQIDWQKDGNREYRVMVLGDSFTEGVGVEEEQTYSEILERKLSNSARRAAFINCGLTGVGPIQYARVFYHLGLKLNPDQVLVMLYANDVADTQGLHPADLESGEGWLIPRRGNEHRQGLKKILHALWPRIYIRTALLQKKFQSRKRRDIVRASIEEARKRGIKDEVIFKWASGLPQNWVAAANKEEFNGNLLTKSLFQPDFWPHYLDIETDDARNRLDTVLAILSKIHRTCQERGLPMGVVYAPASFQYDPQYQEILGSLNGRIKPEWLYKDTVFEARLAEWSVAQAVPFLNLTPHFRAFNKKSPGKYHYAIDGHWTAHGNEEAANAILDWMRKTGMLPARLENMGPVDVVKK